MGAIIKFILIFLILTYLIRKVGGFFLKVLFGEGATSQGNASYGRQNQGQKKRSYGNVFIKKRPQHDKKEPHVTGGEYVDFEEVKD